MILYGEVPLGNDGECESCGLSYNHILYEYDTVSGVHTVRSRVGCLGGASRSGSAGEVVNLLWKYKGWPGGVEVKELIRHLVGG